MSSICLPPDFFADDRVRMLSNHEIVDFQKLMLFAAKSRWQERGVIPAMPLATLARKSGIQFKRLEKRLEKLQSYDVQLVRWRDDGSLEVEGFGNWDEDAPSSFPLSNREDAGSRNGSASGSIARSNGAERTARYRARLAQLDAEFPGESATGASQREASQNGKSDALNDRSDAKASQNGHSSVTEASHQPASGVTQTPRNGVTEASQPSRTRDDNVQRLGLDLNSFSKQDQTMNDNNVVAAVPVTPTVTPASTPRHSVPRNSASGSPPNPRARFLAAQAVAFARELGDDAPRPGFPQGNVPRHYQLLGICEEHNLLVLAEEALAATKRRAASRSREPLREGPGAYYSTTLTRKLGAHGVNVPTRAELEAEPVSEVQRLIRESLEAANPPGVTPLEDLYPETEDNE